MLLVGTTIFSIKKKNYMDLTYLKYFRQLEFGLKTMIRELLHCHSYIGSC
jgi:hypothetical protein